MLLLLILYIYIYSPQLRVLEFGIGKTVSIFAFIYFIFHWKETRYIKLFKTEILLYALLIAYTLVLAVAGDGSAYIVPYQHISFIADCLIAPVFLYLFIIRYNIQYIDINILRVGIVGALITMSLIIYPDVNLFIRQYIIYDDLDSGTVQDSLRFIRGFTFSDSSTFGFGVTQGLFIGLLLIYYKKNPIYILAFPLLIISILFNARIGLVVALLSVIMSLKNVGIKNILILSLISYFAFMIIQNSYLLYEYKQTFEWALLFFSETKDYYGQKELTVTTYDTLFGDMMFVPDNIFSIIFGEGVMVMGKNRSSDVGYINQLYVGGVIYLSIIMASLVYHSSVFRNNSNSYLFVLFILSLLIVNIKGQAMFTSTSFFRLFMLIYVIMKCSRYDKIDLLRYRIWQI